MKQFLAVYMGTPPSKNSQSQWHNLDEATRKARQNEGMKAWGDWMQKHQAAIVTQGGPLGKTKSASSHGISDIKNAMTGFIIVQAETHEAAAQMFENHPHFAIFPGDSVEIMECLPMPNA